MALVNCTAAMHACMGVRACMCVHVTRRALLLYLLWPPCAVDGPPLLVPPPAHVPFVVSSARARARARARVCVCVSFFLLQTCCTRAQARALNLAHLPL
ncbi:hypothetical protein EON66_05510 [archaeon]|nr:MAG: hypothetical protein EON66_05510 [archaeon]